jgi:hypothetical protein
LSSIPSGNQRGIYELCVLHQHFARRGIEIKYSLMNPSEFIVAVCRRDTFGIRRGFDPSPLSIALHAQTLDVVFSTVSNGLPRIDAGFMNAFKKYLGRNEIPSLRSIELRSAARFATRDPREKKEP